MEIRDLDMNTDLVTDMFPQSGSTPKKDMSVRFGMEELKELNTDLLKDNNPAPAAVPGDAQTAVNQELNLNQQVNTDLLNVPPAKKEEVKETVEPAKEGDKQQQQQQAAPELKPEELKGISEYFQRKVTEGKFVAVNDVDDKGNKTAFIPKTIEDFDEVIQIQLDYKLEQAKKDVEEQWYRSKSPAWKAISQYADMVDDPTQLIPFLQGVKTIQSVEQLDENEIDGAEMIVRSHLERRGDPEEVVSTQIESLKTSDKLISTAKTIKPLVINQEKQMLAQQVREKELYEQRVANEMNDIRNKAYTEIEKPFFGKQNLKKEEKALVYNLLAQYDDQTDGFVLYSELDKLYAKRDFETLKQVALLLSNKDAFYQYIGTDIANRTAGSLQRKLQAATDARSASGNDYDEQNAPAVTRNKPTGQVRFGR